MAGKSSLQCPALYYGSLCLQCIMVKTVISSRAMKNLTVTLSLENKKKWSGKSLKKVLNSVHKKVYEPCLLQF